jgi:IS30 family transposase
MQNKNIDKNNDNSLINTKHYKHLTLDDRIKIEYGLKSNYTLSQIAKDISKNPRTISFEIKNHLRRKINDRYKFTNSTTKPICNKHLKYPYVCDNCKLKKYCKCDFFYYSASLANKDYETVLHNSRKGANLTKDEFDLMDNIIKEGVDKNQSFAHIKYSNSSISVSERTMYRYLSMGYLSVKPSELTYKNKLKKRINKKDININYDPTYLNNRKLDDYNNLIKHNLVRVIQMDTVYGLMTDKKVILTFINVHTHLFYAVLLNTGATALNIKKAIDSIELKIGLDKFKEMFRVILTDRGSEFKRPEEIETSLDGFIRTKVFYCNPLAGYEKGVIENIHKLLRHYLPKKESIDHLTSKTLSLIVSHINSYRRDSTSSKTPYELTEFFYGKEALDNLGIKKIESNKVILNKAIFNL